MHLTLRTKPLYGGSKAIEEWIARSEDDHFGESFVLFEDGIQRHGDVYPMGLNWQMGSYDLVMTTTAREHSTCSYNLQYLRRKPLLAAIADTYEGTPIHRVRVLIG